MTRKERIARERAAREAGTQSADAPPVDSPAVDSPVTEPAESTPSAGSTDVSAASAPRPVIRHANSEPARPLGAPTQPMPQVVASGQPAYPQQGYPQDAYPQQGYPQPTFAQGATPVPAAAAATGPAATAGNPLNNNTPGDDKPKYEPLGPVRGTIRTFGELCITVGLVLILFVGWQLWWTDIAADQDNRDLTTQLTDKWEHDKPQAKGDPSNPVVSKEPAENTAFGIMYVPRFGDRYYRTVAEGVEMEPVLNRMGLGHYPGTPMPGDKGNFAVAGHRVTYGKPLNQIAELRPGDEIVVQTKEGFYTYTFRNFDIVLPSQVDVLDPVPAFPKYKGKDRIMTLTACNPMFSARERYIAYATLTDFKSAAQGAPDAIKDSPAFKKVGGK